MSEQQIVQLDFFAHRSGHETHQYCDRRRYLNYHHLGTGINTFPPIYFDIGTVVHLGLAHLGESAIACANVVEQCVDVEICKEAVALALDAFHLTVVYQTLKEFERAEQDTLIAALLWAFWYRAWPAFINKWEVLMVEAASEDVHDFDLTPALPVATPARLHLLSRPDMIVRERETGEVTAINWKTINSLSEERRSNITQSLQVNLEAFYAEKMYAKWMDENWEPDIPAGMRGRQLQQYLDEQLDYYKSLPREVANTQIVYLVKGARLMTLADGMEVETDQQGNYPDVEKFWRQDTPLCYRWVDLAGGGIAPVSWAYRFYKTGNVSYSQITPKKNYAKQPVWEAEELAQVAKGGEYRTPVQQWVHQLNAGAVFPSTLAQSDDRNEKNPLDRVVVFENAIERDVDMQSAMRAGVIRREQQIARDLVQLPVLADTHGLDHALDLLFPRQLISCRHPVRCEFDGKLCNVAKEARTPLFTELPERGVWQLREGHHTAEIEALNRVKGEK